MHAESSVKFRLLRACGAETAEGSTFGNGQYQSVIHHRGLGNPLFSTSSLSSERGYGTAISSTSRTSSTALTMAYSACAGWSILPDAVLSNGKPTLPGLIMTE